MSEAADLVARLRKWVAETDSETEQAKHPKQYDMWMTGYEQAMLDVDAILGPAPPKEYDALGEIPDIPFATRIFNPPEPTP